jgi:RNA-directed DNA polymerase
MQVADQGVVVMKLLKDSGAKDLACLVYEEETTSNGMIDYYETKSQPITKVMVWQAYKKVKANNGGAGVDQMDWSYLEANKKTELYKLWNRLTSGTYFPMPVRQVEITKKTGGIRTLGIPTLLDRIAQEVARVHLEKILEPIFHSSSFGYRPNRSCHDAVAQANYNCFNYNFAIDIDIKGFFDTIDHTLMLKAVKHYCDAKWILLYVERWLKAGIVQRDGNLQRTELGTPQGGVISPLLSNLFLHVVFDKWMEEYHHQKPFERYADDIVVHCSTERQAIHVLRVIRERMEACKLSLHPTKTKIVNIRAKTSKIYPRSFDFLGFTIRLAMVTFKGKACLVPRIFVSMQSKSSMLKKFKELQIHKKRKSLAEVAKELRPIINGLMNYYHKWYKRTMFYVWNQLNARLLKWVKWEKGLYKYASRYWLRAQYKKYPRLFPHWELVHP